MTPGARLPAVVLAGLAWLAPAPPLSAHHSVLPFDGTRPTTITGVVTRIVWQNPHTHISLDVTDDRGGVERWGIESEGPRLLGRLGWTEESVTVGDLVTSVGARARSGERLMRCKTIETADGRRLPCFPTGSSR
jgi:hypothetical protein